MFGGVCGLRCVIRRFALEAQESSGIMAWIKENKYNFELSGTLE